MVQVWEKTMDLRVGVLIRASWHLGFCDLGFLEFKVYGA